MNSESHSMEKKQLLESLKATEKGLTTQEAENRLQEYASIVTGGSATFD